MAKITSVKTSADNNKLFTAQVNDDNTREFKEYDITSGINNKTLQETADVTSFDEGMDVITVNPTGDKFVGVDRRGRDVINLSTTNNFSVNSFSIIDTIKLGIPDSVSKLVEFNTVNSNGVVTNSFINGQLINGYASDFRYAFNLTSNSCAGQGQVYHNYAIFNGTNGITEYNNSIVFSNLGFSLNDYQMAKGYIPTLTNDNLAQGVNRVSQKTMNLNDNNISIANVDKSSGCFYFSNSTFLAPIITYPITSKIGFTPSNVVLTSLGGFYNGILFLNTLNNDLYYLNIYEGVELYKIDTNKFQHNLRIGDHLIEKSTGKLFEVIRTSPGRIVYKDMGITLTDVVTNLSNAGVSFINENNFTSRGDNLIVKNGDDYYGYILS